MKPLFWLLFASSITALAQQLPQSKQTKIAFGSCGHQDHPLPIFDEVVRHKPDLFIFLGDNIYGDTDDMQVLRDKYQKLGDKPTFQRLKATTPIVATWDDHDFGRNDAGRHYPFKEEAKDAFLSFFNEPTPSPRREHPGIYTSYTHQIQGKVLQIILLDVRTFRDDLQLFKKGDVKEKKYFYSLDYTPFQTADSTLLGESQWSWLEKQLEQPADIRLIGSGSQFSIEYNGYEAWANFPHEQKRMLQLIQKTKANGVVFLSGDVHYGEISKLEVPNGYPIYDLTSSGLSSTWHFATPNKNRIEGPIMENHFGLLTIDWSKKDPTLQTEIIDVTGNTRVEYTFPLSEIRLK